MYLRGSILVATKAAATGPLVAFCLLGNFGPDTGQAWRVSCSNMGGSQNWGVPFLEAPIIRIIVLWGVYWGPFI